MSYKLKTGLHGMEEVITDEHYRNLPISFQIHYEAVSETEEIEEEVVEPVKDPEPVKQEPLVIKEPMDDSQVKGASTELLLVEEEFVIQESTELETKENVVTEDQTTKAESAVKTKKAKGK